MELSTSIDIYPKRTDKSYNCMDIYPTKTQSPEKTRTKLSTKHVVFLHNVKFHLVQFIEIQDLEGMVWYQREGRGGCGGRHHDGGRPQPLRRVPLVVHQLPQHQRCVGAAGAHHAAVVEQESIRINRSGIYFCFVVFGFVTCARVPGKSCSNFMY